LTCYVAQLVVVGVFLSYTSLRVFLFNKGYVSLPMLTVMIVDLNQVIISTCKLDLAGTAGNASTFIFEVSLCCAGGHVTITSVASLR
jgi:hypothetical protein